MEDSLRRKSAIITVVAMTAALLAIGAPANAATSGCRFKTIVGVTNMVTTTDRCSVTVPCDGPCEISVTGKVTGIGLVGMAFTIYPTGAPGTGGTCGFALNTCTAEKSARSNRKGPAVVTCGWTGLVAVQIKVTCDVTVTPLEDPIGVGVVSSVATVPPGDSFSYVISVTNNGTTCDLTTVKVIDTVAVPGGDFVINGGTPFPDLITPSQATWNDIGPISPGQQKILTLDVTGRESLQPGFTFTDDVNVTAECAGNSFGAAATVEAPQVTNPA